MESERERNIQLPEKYFKEFSFYIEKDVDPDYVHASADAHEAFRDMKFGVRIHFGLYSIKEWHGESWPFLWLSHKEKQAYQEMYKTWNPTGFDAEEWMQFFDRAGFKCFAMTTKHHEGFCMYDTKTRVTHRINWVAKGGPAIEECDQAYSIMETPFKRDIVKELVDAGRAHGIKVDLYFSHPDWYDADFRPYGHHPVMTPSAKKDPQLFDAHEKKLPRKSPILPDPDEETSTRMMTRHREQLVEIVSNYIPDMCCLDIRLGPENWPHVKETIKMLRKIHPDVMLRNRGIANYGDYYTPEGVVPGDPSNTQMPWMVIYPLGLSFSYEKHAKMYKGTKWVVHNLVDTVAKGGNFMVGIGPGKNGTFHLEAIRQLEAAGAWIKVNGEGIYGTRQWPFAWKEDNTRFTMTKDCSTVFTFVLEWPGASFTSHILKPQEGSAVTMLGYPNPLNWEIIDSDLVVDLPAELAANKPCDHAWCFKVEV
jgi:alpha-L-fucosidase